jgi:hypothetical protein
MGLEPILTSRPFNLKCKRCPKRSPNPLNEESPPLKPLPEGLREGLHYLFYALVAAIQLITFKLSHRIDPESIPKVLEMY